MAAITPGSLEVEFQFDPDVLDAALASIRSLADLALEPEASDGIVDEIDGIAEVARSDPEAMFALRTDKLRLLFEPSEWYLLRVATLAAWDVERHLIHVEFRHGWPILSVCVRNTTVAAGPVESIGRAGCPIHSDPSGVAISPLGSTPDEPQPLADRPACALSTSVEQ